MYGSRLNERLDPLCGPDTPAELARDRNFTKSRRILQVTSIQFRSRFRVIPTSLTTFLRLRLLCSGLSLGFRMRNFSSISDANSQVRISGRRGFWRWGSVRLTHPKIVLLAHPLQSIFYRRDPGNTRGYRTPHSTPDTGQGARTSDHAQIRENTVPGLTLSFSSPIAVYRWKTGAEPNEERSGNRDATHCTRNRARLAEGEPVHDDARVSQSE